MKLVSSGVLVSLSCVACSAGFHVDEGKLGTSFDGREHAAPEEPRCHPSDDLSDALAFRNVVAQVLDPVAGPAHGLAREIALSQVPMPFGESLDARTRGEALAWEARGHSIESVRYYALSSPCWPDESFAYASWTVGSRSEDRVGWIVAFGTGPNPVHAHAEGTFVR